MRMAGGRAVAAAIVGCAQVRAAFDDLAGDLDVELAGVTAPIFRTAEGVLRPVPLGDGGTPAVSASAARVPCPQQPTIFFARYIRSGCPPRLAHERFSSSRRRVRGRGMSSILVLVALSALSGFAFASYFSWPAVLVAGVVLAPLSAIVLQNQGFRALARISVIIACLTISQVAYLIGRIRADDGPSGGSSEGTYIPA
jgi:hypothetical protein